MSSDPLHSYLSTFRKRACLTQEDVAYIVAGSMRTASVARHERGDTLPGLAVLLKYELLFGVSREELFTGWRNELLDEMRPRIRGTIASLRKRKEQTPSIRARIAHLERLLAHNP